MRRPKFFGAWRDDKGLSAVEFALIGPAIAFLAIALIDAVNFAVSVTSMQRAERAAVQYFMNGGTSLTAAKGIVTTAWNNPPSNSSVTTAQVCKCGNSVQSCPLSGSPLICINGNAPSFLMTVTASGTVTGILTSLPESRTETVRVR
ncbi:MAG TPA: hypothetical protein VHT03_03295 [Rhizomicrobium sp.]|jgi:Flp pilus assembly protein TadG|nr:hypothetical protein [Rhizomicrobium sp.]